MIRKMLLIASAVAMPLGATAVTAIAGPTVAGAASVAIVCHPTAPLASATYAPPGLSVAGVFPGPASTNTTTSAQVLNCTGGATGPATVAPQSIAAASTACTAVNTPVTGCPGAGFWSNSLGGLAAAGTTLWMGLPTLSFHIGSTAYTMTNSSSNPAAGCIALGELGFTIHGVISAGPAARIGHAAKYVACLGADTGPNTTGSTTADLGAPPAGMLMVTSVIDANSKIRIA